MDFQNNMNTPNDLAQLPEICKIASEKLDNLRAICKRNAVLSVMLDLNDGDPADLFDHIHDAKPIIKWLEAHKVDADCVLCEDFEHLDLNVEYDSLLVAHAVLAEYDNQLNTLNSFLNVLAS